MDHTEVLSTIKANYSPSQTSKLLNLSEEALAVLASSCKEGNKINLSDSSIDRLLTMEPCRQSGWLANPFMEYLMDMMMASYSLRPQNTAQPAKEVKKPQPEPQPETKKPKPEPEPDDAVPFDLFA